jgi:glutamate synthase (NADPH/NADH) large chain
VDGQLKTARDVVVAALLGAEEFGFATAPLVVMGCVMMRVCHLNTCPVGIATQDPELRKRFTGKPEFVQRFFEFLAAEVRELMAGLGFRTIDELVGRSECLEFAPAIEHWKAAGLDLSPLLHQPDLPPGAARRAIERQNAGLAGVMDHALVAEAAPALERGTPVVIARSIRNTDRTTGTLLGYEVTRRYGSAGLPDDSIRVQLTGSAGQSFGAFLAKGVPTISLARDCREGIWSSLHRERRRSCPKTTSSSVTSRSTAPPAARPSCAAWPASASRCGTAAPKRWSRAWAITAAST